MLELNGVTKIFNKGTINENKVFDNINLKINDGDFISIIGSNGAGKSTLLNLIAGVYPVDKGSIKIDNVDITKQPEYKRSRYIGRVFQNPLMGTAPGMTIEENLSMALNRGKRLSLKKGINKSNVEFFKEKLKSMGLGLENRLKDKVELLSGGQRQVLTLLMATMITPKLLLLDEHTAALDPQTAKLVNELTNDIVKQNHITTLMITHNMEHAIATGNRLLMMHNGHIVLDIKERDKKMMTIPKLLCMFEEVQGNSFDDDRVMLAN